MDSLKQAVRFLRYFAVLFVSLSFLLGCEQKQLPQQKVAVQQPAEPVEQGEKPLRRAIYAEKFQLDPHFVSSAEEAAPVRDLLKGLLSFNEKGQVVPAVAKEWFSENDKDWLFILDDNATWSNGEPVTALDFVASWQRLADPEKASPMARYLVYMNIENAPEVLTGKKPVSALGVMALNPNTLQIRLKKPNKQLIKMLAHVALLPTFRGGVPNAAHFIGNGDYKLVEQSDKLLKLEAVKNDLDFAKVEYHNITPLQAIKQFDVIENPLTSQQHNIWEFPRLCTYYYEFNFADPELKKKEVRQAIKAMILSARIPQQYGMANFSVLPKSMQTPSSTQWTPVVIEQLLKQAGISASHPLKLEVLYDEQGRHGAIANQVIRTLGESDLFQVQPKAVTWQQLLALREQKQFQLSRAGWCADYPDPLPFLLHFHSQSPDNKSHYRNPLVDKQLEQLENERLSEEKRQQIIQHVAQQIDSDVAILPMFQYHRRVALDSTILGIDLNNNSEVIYSKHLYRMKPKD